MTWLNQPKVKVIFPQSGNNKFSEQKVVSANWVKVIGGQLWVSCFEQGIYVYDFDLELRYKLKTAALNSVYDVTLVDGESRVLVVASSVGLKEVIHKG